MKVSATEEFGVRCLMRLAQAWDRGTSATIPEVAGAEGMSPQYVAKLVGLARQAGLVETTRGVHGGIRLAREPGAITLHDAFEAFSGEALRTGRCVEPAASACGRAPDCGLRHVFGALRRVVSELLSNVTLRDLVRMEGDRNWRPAAVAHAARSEGAGASSNESGSIFE